MRTPRPAGNRRPRGSAGFTLIELMVSLAIVGMMLIALNTFVFSMGELWGRNTDYRLFHEHVNAVTRFLTEELQAATLPPAARANSTPIAIEQITPLSGISDNLVTFDLPSGCRLLDWPDRPLPEVTCSLQARPDGLYLLWQSRLETTYGTQPPRELLLTPFCTAIEYDYYDDNFKQWTRSTTLETDPTTGLLETPQRLLLEFTYGKFTAETAVPVPVALQGPPNT